MFLQSFSLRDWIRVLFDRIHEYICRDFNPYTPHLSNFKYEKRELYLQPGKGETPKEHICSSEYTAIALTTSTVRSDLNKSFGI